jgi:IPT/TIG domain
MTMASVQHKARRAMAVVATRVRNRDDRTGGETGAALVLALVFMVVIGMMVGAMAAWTGNSLQNAANFQSARNQNYALYGATQTAIQNIRYNPLLGAGQTLNANPPYDCWEPSPVPTPPQQSQLTLNGSTIDVFCSTVWNPTSASTRVVTVSACVAPATAQACAATPGLQTIVAFDDYSTGNPSINPGVCTTTCGAGMTVNSSTTPQNLPTVTTLSATSGPVNVGTVITVTGTGFASSGTVVNLVSTNASQNLVLSGTGVQIGSSTSLTVTAPPSTTATSFYVEVTTPNGTSPVVPGVSPTFTYQSVVPQVTGVSGPGGSSQGSAAGGSAITITGTGFLDSAAGDSTSVNFVDMNNTGNVVQSPYAKVSAYSNGTQTITAVTPAITTTDMTYFVTVTTSPGGTSPQNASYKWTFQPLTPVVSGVGPVTGGSGTQLTITGIGFVGSGQTTVQLVPTGGGGTTLNAANVSVQSSTQLTATVPSGGQANGTYYVEVTTTTGGSSGSNGSPVYTY